MKNIIPFSKDIKFNTKIYEITSISLENNLIVEEDNTIDGEFIISGNYKMNDISINTEPFIYNIPFNISLSDKYNNDTIKIDIDDFKYEIINEEILKVNIDVLVKGEYTQIEEEITPDVVINVNNERDEEEIDLFKEEDNSIEVNSIFDEVDTSNDKYISYYVHIIRESDNIETISKIYNVSIEDIKEYNNIEKLILGEKIIIPTNETI